MFDDIISKRQNWRIGIDPLWKLLITDVEYKELNNYLYDQNQVHITTYRWCREAALYFAEWWKREYNGGPHNIKDVAESLNLANIDDLYKAAKEGAKRLRISYIRRGNTRRLDTLFMQGGLPLRALNSEGVNNRYRNYLNTIVKYICSHHINWENTDFIQNFNPYIASCFHSEVMYDLTLQIARAIYYEDNTYFPFNIEDKRFEELIKELRETKQHAPRVIREIPFEIRWIIEKSNGELKLSYEIEYETIISQDWVATNLNNNSDPFRTLDVIINNRSAQKYIRKNNGDYAVKFTNLKIIGRIEDFSDSVLSIQLSSNNNRIFDIAIPDCDIPDLNEPSLVTFLDTLENVSRWMIVNNPVPQNINAVVCSTDWESESTSEVVTINNNTLSWFQFEQTISLKRGSDIIQYDTNYLLNYKVDFGAPMIIWIQKANYFILTSNPDITIYDFEDNKLNGNQYNIFYRLKGNDDWNKYYKKLQLPVGLVEFSVKINNQSPLRKKFYHTGPINFNIVEAHENRGIIQWTWEEGTIVPINLNNGIEIQSGSSVNRFQVTYNQDETSFPKTIKFELKSKQDPNTKLSIEVATPFSGVVLLDPTGRKVTSGKSICATALLGYRCIINGIDEIPVHIQFFKNETDPYPFAEETAKFHKGLENNLQMLELPIRTIFRICKHSIFEYLDKGYYRIKFGTYLTVNVKLFNGDTRKEDKVIYITNTEGNRIDNFPYTVYAAPVNCSQEQIKLIELQRQEDGSFCMASENSSFNELIIFSGMSSNSHIHLRPRYYNLNSKLNPEDIPENRRMEIHMSRIQEIKNELLKNEINHDSWKTVEKYIDIVIDKNLPFETFACFCAISREKKLMTRLAVMLFLRHTRDQSRMNIELNRFEDEFGNPWHWINKESWDTAINDSLAAEEIDETLYMDYRNQLYKRIISLISSKSIDKNIVENFFTKIFDESNNFYANEPLSPEVIQTEKRKYNNGNGIFIPEYVYRFHPDIPLDYRRFFNSVQNEDLPKWGGLLLSPLFSALAFSGKNKIFDEDHPNNRRTSSRQRMLYYLELDPEWYFYVFKIMVNRIHQVN